MADEPKIEKGPDSDFTLGAAEKRIIDLENLIGGLNPRNFGGLRKKDLIQATLANLFGDGSDGDVVISADTDLTTDKFYDNLTIKVGFTLSTKGYRVFVRNTLLNNGTIAADGGNGGVGGVGVSNTPVQSAGSGGGSGGSGAPGGTVAIYAKTLINEGVIRTHGGVGGNGGAGGAPEVTGSTSESRPPGGAGGAAGAAAYAAAALPDAKAGKAGSAGGGGGA